MLKRVRAKEAKRKAENEADEQNPIKKRCQRGERIALVQLKAYWDCYPRQTGKEQLRKTRDAESSEDELIEDNGQEQTRIMRTGPSSESSQELIVANIVPSRRRYLEELKECIKGKREATQEKRRKLDPPNSREHPSAINGKVEHAYEDCVRDRIKGKGQQASFKRGTDFEAPNAERQENKFQQKGNAVYLQPHRRGENSMKLTPSTSEM